MKAGGCNLWQHPFKERPIHDAGSTMVEILEVSEIILTSAGWICGGGFTTSVRGGPF